MCVCVRVSCLVNFMGSGKATIYMNVGARPTYQTLGHRRDCQRTYTYGNVARIVVREKMLTINHYYHTQQ